MIFRRKRLPSCAGLQGLAGVALAATMLAGAGLVNTAEAQPLTANELWTYDTSDLFRGARRAQTDRRCGDFLTIMSELRRRAHVTVDSDLEINLTELILFILPDAPVSERRLNPYSAFGPVRAEEYYRLEREGCPRRTVGPAVSFQAATGVLNVPGIKGGTQFSGGTEIPIVRSDESLTGGGGSFFATIPLPPSANNVLWGDYFYVGASGATFSGDAFGSVPAGGNTVAQTYIFPNPASGSTGINAGATGQNATIETDGRVIDVKLGLKSVTPLPGAGPVNGPPDERALQGLFGGPLVGEVHTTFGFRYRNIDLTHTITQRSINLADLNSRIELDQNSHFFGPQFGVGLISAPPGSDPGPVFRLFGHVSPGVLVTDADASQFSRCGPCGAGSPEFNVVLGRDFSDSRFSVIVGGDISVGYRFNAFSEIFVRGSVEHMTGVPFFNVPTTPNQQPIDLGFDSVTRGMVIVGIRTEFGVLTFDEPRRLSDRRLKRDIAEVGRLANGLKLYRYRYLWSDAEYVGVMAQEVALLRPDAVARDANGFLSVDYGKLGLRMLTWQQWRAARSLALVTAGH